eukprot:1377852-Amorphochlora_amoeboformis.AAC.1
MRCRNINCRTTGHHGLLDMGVCCGWDIGGYGRVELPEAPTATRFRKTAFREKIFAVAGFRNVVYYDVWSGFDYDCNFL